MMPYSVRLVDRRNENDPGEIFNLKLSPNATILDLRNELSKDGEFENPDRLRITYQLEQNQSIGLEDEDLLSEITKQKGEFIAELDGLGTYGMVNFEVKDELVANVAVLVGSAKRFEHFLLNRRSNKIKLPNGILQ